VTTPPEAGEIVNTSSSQPQVSVVREPAALYVSTAVEPFACVIVMVRLTASYTHLVRAC